MRCDTVGQRYPPPRGKGCLTVTAPPGVQDRPRYAWKVRHKQHEGAICLLGGLPLVWKCCKAVEH